MRGREDVALAVKPGHAAYRCPAMAAYLWEIAALRCMHVIDEDVELYRMMVPLLRYKTVIWMDGIKMLVAEAQGRRLWPSRKGVTRCRNRFHHILQPKPSFSVNFYRIVAYLPAGAPPDTK